MMKIKILTTGGTIAAVPGDSGLEPSVNSDSILGYLHEFSRRFHFDHEDVLQLDSSNIQPEEWQMIARKVFAALPECDGVIVTHGTDTLSYTASALSYMLQGLDKPVVLTGSQIPIDSPFTDARTNLCTAIAAIEAGMQGILVAFDRRIINGARAVKTSTMAFDAFQSVNSEDMARVYVDGLRVRQNSTSVAPGGPTLADQLCTDVFLLKLIPGTRPEIFDAIMEVGYKGVVIEAFGAGGIHYIHRDLLEKLHIMNESGIAVVVCSQCLYERSDLKIYKVGQRIMHTGAISALDMTTEAAVTKLMWALGQTNRLEEIRAIFAASLVGEIDVS